MVQSKRREEFAINVGDIVGHNKDRRQFGKAASFAEATTLGSKYQNAPPASADGAKNFSV
jgi:hypothetical protein